MGSLPDLKLKKIMKKEKFEILMYALYGNNQLFIPQGQDIQEWIDNAFDNALKEG
jgi:hypothetical protein